VSAKYPKAMVPWGTPCCNYPSN